MNKNTHPTKRSKNRRLKTAVRILAFLLLVAIAALAYCLFSYGFFDRFLAPKEMPSPASAEENATPAPVTNTITFLVPEGKGFVLDVVDGESFEMPEGPSIPGYTFLAWLDINGEAETRESIVPADDLYYSASYAVAFLGEEKAGSHEPYMSLDENALFHPNAGITRGEMIGTVYRFLDLNGVGSGYFIDIDREDPLYTASATLKDLGLIEGDRLHPEDTVTYGEFFTLLSKLFPEAKEQYSFENVSVESEYYRPFCTAMERGWLSDPETSAYDFIPKAEFVHIFNQLIGRRTAGHIDNLFVGTILDVPASNQYYADIAEALVEHEYTIEDDSERWIGSKPLPQRDSGFYFIGSELRCIKENGSAAVNESVGSFYFDENGVYSSGDAALDELVRVKISELVDPATMSRDDMLKILYDFVLNDSFYLGGEKYDMGETGWEIPKAYQMLSTGKGNCYAYAATFWALSRAVGCDAVCYSGCVGTHDNPHAWVEIELDGTPYIFDPTLEYEQWYGPGTHTFERFFMKTYDSVKGWNYDRGEE